MNMEPMRPSVDLSTFTSTESKENTRGKLQDLLLGKKIAVITRELGGKGDFLCAKKIYDYIHNILQVPKEHLLLALSREPSQTAGLFPDKEIRQISNEREAITKESPDVCIFAPAHDDLFVLSRVELDKTTPTIAISEYGYEPITTLKEKYIHAHPYAFGFKREALGFLTSPELREWATKKTPPTSLDQLRQLKYVSEHIQRAILCNREYSEEAIEEFSKTSKLYFGYAQRGASVNAFITGVIAMLNNAHDTCTPCFFIMGDPLGFNLDTLKEVITDKTIKRISLLRDNKEISMVCNPEGSRDIRIVVSKMIPDEVASMHKASERETLTTGDQSFSEAISVGKFPLYEIFSHKEKMYAEFLDLFPSKIIKLVPKIHVDSEESTADIGSFFIYKFNDPCYQSLIKETLNKVVTEFDFAPRFDKIFLEALNQAKSDKIKGPICITLPELSKLTGDEIPFDTPIYLTLDDVDKLQIRSKNGRSKLPQYKNNSTFDCTSVDGLRFLVQRHKLVETEESSSGPLRISLPTKADEINGSEIPFNTAVLLRAKDVDTLQITYKFPGRKVALPIEAKNIGRLKIKKVECKHPAYAANSEFEIQPDNGLFLIYRRTKPVL